jgi:Fe-S-cluster containining protein
MSGNVTVILTLFNTEADRFFTGSLPSRSEPFHLEEKCLAAPGNFVEPFIKEEKCMTHESCCARCAQAGKTCCQQTEIYVTMDDVKRIAASTARIDFFEYRAPADPVYLSAENDPLWQHHVFRLDGTRRVLKQQPAGDCFFLAGSGCQLDPEVRPLICRLYPLTYTDAGLEAEPDERCPLRQLCPGQTVTEVFGISMQQALRWHMELYREMKHPEGGSTDENWTDLRPAI